MRIEGLSRNDKKKEKYML